MASIGFEIAIAIISTIVSSFSLVQGIKKFKHRKESSVSEIKIKLKTGDIYEINTNNLSIKDIEEIILQLAKEDIEKNIEPVNSKETGNILLEVLLLIIPAIIALLFAVTFVYLLVKNEANQQYATPKELQAAMTTILGYYFGIGASSAVNKGKILSPEEIKAILNNK
ncbi:MAG: hypothetical protein WAX77_03405 [Methylococcaceae bacterium]